MYGEDLPHNRDRMLMREFCLGEAKVKEPLSYDHVGIPTSVDEADVSGIKEKLAKARTTFNTATGLGICKNGLTMATCNVIFLVPSCSNCPLWVQDLAFEW